ncbi:gamma-glutamyltransferase [Acetomicrobium sp. S15 = DSM 107314]|uniref:gamma-glutamyltransferase n=1 Tax=Acetomicrobium sp. S15 = DSM 107314 TaxID=2529858 RepID=UPI0018E0CAB5
MTFDPLTYRYPSRRNVVFSRLGMVSTGQVLAAQAGLEILKKGGNAVDAAVATAACLTVTEPTSCGIGGDAFCIICTDGKLYGLNASGCAPKALSIERLKKEGYDEIPKSGWVPVTVPGVPAAWAELIKKFGKLPLKDVLRPAAEYARNGYPVSPTVSSAWKESCSRFEKELSGEIKEAWFETFAPRGRAPQAGETLNLPDHAETLELIGESESEVFYRGEIARKIADFARKTGGFIDEEDLASFAPEWVEPVKIDYRGYDVWELPPNGQSIVALIALNILKGFSFTEKENPVTYHLQIEAIKAAFADGLAYIADPSCESVPTEELLSQERTAKRRALIGQEAKVWHPGPIGGSDTVYLATADGNGNMVSYIQSNYMGFGSGIVVPKTGVALQNRGACFSLSPDHPNALRPGKRPYHTIIPGFISKDGKPIGPFGIMGAFMQPQAHVQVLMNMLDFGLNPQEALDAPRWMWVKCKEVLLEYGFPEHIAAALARRGHDVAISSKHAPFGRGQIIWRMENGNLCGGTEPRTDGTIAAW